LSGSGTRAGCASSASTCHHDRRDRKHTQHRPSVKEKEKVPAPRVAPRSTDEESDGYRRGGRGGKSKLKKRNQHGFQNPT
ncbi:hypothetical protein ACV334_33045, partial [Pseudomonas aeruginosa]